MLFVSVGQSLTASETMNPVILLDEIDKIGTSEGSALLEVLDPGQNNAFHDNYIGDVVDLSNVLFIVSNENTFTSYSFSL